MIDANIKYDRDTGKSKGFGHVTFSTVAAANKALEKNGADMNGRGIVVDKAEEKTGGFGGAGGAGGFQQRTPQAGFGGRGAGDTPQKNPAELFVKGFDSSMGEEAVRSALEEVFGQYGAIKRVSIPTNRETGELRGIAFVEFGNEGEKTAALEADGSEAAGGYLKVDANTGGGGGRGGGRGGFGGRGGGRGFGGGRGGGRGFGGRDGGRGGGRGFGGRDGGRGGGRGFGGRGGGMRIDMNAGGAGKKMKFDE